MIFFAHNPQAKLTDLDRAAWCDMLKMPYVEQEKIGLTPMWNELETAWTKLPTILRLSW
jgi:hypothetical protein